MTPSPYYYQSLYRCTKADWDAYRRWTDFLPRRTTEPYHSGPHSVRCLRAAYEMVCPGRVLEIGFNLGHSSVIWLELGVARVVSVEVRDDKKVRDAGELIAARYPNRFELTIKEPGVVLIPLVRYDLTFIDGSHERKDVCEDIWRAVMLDIPWLLLDDYDTGHGPGVVEAVRECGLIPVAIFGTMALCRSGRLFTMTSDPLGLNYYE